MANQTHFGVWKSLVSFPEGGDVLDLVGHLEDQERKYLSYIPDFEGRMRFLVLICPSNLASMVDGVIEEYCDEFSMDQHRVQMGMYSIMIWGAMLSPLQCVKCRQGFWTREFGQITRW